MPAVFEILEVLFVYFFLRFMQMKSARIVAYNPKITHFIQIWLSVLPRDRRAPNCLISEFMDGQTLNREGTKKRALTKFNHNI